MADFFIKQNDTTPILQATLKDADGNAVDLTGATVRFHMADAAFNSKVDAAGTVHDAPNGVVRYEWQADDTDTAGEFIAEWEVTYADNEVESFPSEYYLEIKVGQELG